MNNIITSIRAARSTQSVVNHCRIFTVLAAGFLAVPASAQSGRSDVTISLVAQKVVTKDGKEALVAADRAVPGDVIQYEAHCHNHSQQRVHRLSPSLPIPAGMVFVPGSARPAPAEASLDGMNFSSLPLQRRITRPGGQVAMVEVPATEYRALRWQVGNLDAGSKTNVTARTRLAQR